MWLLNGALDPKSQRRDMTIFFKETPAVKNKKTVKVSAAIKDP